jgi:hypothetical protein
MKKSDDPHAFYTTQSSFTDLGAYAYLVDGLPDDIAGLCRIVQGLVIHYRGAGLFGHTIPPDRLGEIDTRHIAKMLARIVALDDRPLTEARPPEKRLVGCCRDFATLFCALSRAQGIPTRTRVGFAPYFTEAGDPVFHFDHEVSEYWDAAGGRWRLVDPELTERHAKQYRLAFDPTDVPRDQFLVAGLAWQQCRAGAADASRFGVGPDEPIPYLRGMGFILQKLIQDLATQNKRELLLWDVWGLMLTDPTAEDEALLDDVAAVTQGGDATFGRVRALYASAPGLAVAPPVMSFSPVAKPAEVALAEVTPGR